MRGKVVEGGVVPVVEEFYVEAVLGGRGEGNR
jgi:hypothetical protein